MTSTFVGEVGEYPHAEECPHTSSLTKLHSIAFQNGGSISFVHQAIELICVGNFVYTKMLFVQNAVMLYT